MGLIKDSLDFALRVKEITLEQWIVILLVVALGVIGFLIKKFVMPWFTKINLDLKEFRDSLKDLVHSINDLVQFKAIAEEQIKGLTKNQDAHVKRMDHCVEETERTMHRIVEGNINVTNQIQLSIELQKEINEKFRDQLLTIVRDFAELRGEHIAYHKTGRQLKTNK